MEIDLSDLKAFLAVARAKGFRDGARASGSVSRGLFFIIPAGGSCPRHCARSSILSSGRLNPCDVRPLRRRPCIDLPLIADSVRMSA
jgi:hypothetical protein